MMMSGVETRKRRRRKREAAGLGKQVKKFRPISSYREASPVDFDGDRADDGVLTEIFARLPVKSVVRFKSVSKSCLSLISSGYFRTLYCYKPPPSLIITRRLQFSIIKMSQFFYSDQINDGIEEPRVVPFDIHGIRNIININLEIVNCSNGLMLLRRGNTWEYFVYNPSTKQSQKLRLDHHVLWLHSIFDCLHLIYDPSISPHYKIVCLVYTSSEWRQQHIHVFDSETGTWSFGESFEIGAMGNVVQCKNLIYFISGATGCLHCFDIFNRGSQFMVCPLPEFGASAPYSFKLHESDGRPYFCALHIHYKTNSVRATLWELRVNGDDPPRSKWVLKYHHSLRRHIRRKCGEDLGLGLLAIIKTSTFLIHILGKIVAYSFPDRSFKELLHLKTRPYKIHAHFGETLALS